MSRKYLLLAVAAVVALAILAVTLMLGPSTAPSSSATPQQAGDVDLPDVHGREPGTFDSEIGELERGEVVFLQEGRRTVLTYDALTPQEEGILEVEGPVARIIFSPTRVLEVSSQTGTLVAPDGQLLEGTFRGEVVASYLQAPDDQALDLNSDRHVLARFYLERASFDEQLGRLVSNGPVFVTSRAVDAAGEGLSVTFNQLRERLERMVIRQGRKIRFNPNATDSLTPTAASESAEQTPLPSAQTKASEPSSESGESRSPSAEEALQYYTASFFDDVHVQVAFGRADLYGNQMDITFAMDPAGSSETAEVADDGSEQAASEAKLASETSDDQTKTSATDSTKTDTPDADGASADDPRLTPIDRRSLMRQSLGDVVVQWQGRLQIIPDEKPDEDFQGAEDALIALHGEPMRITTDQSELVEAAKGRYLLSNGRITAVSSSEAGLMLDSPRLGIVTGRRLQIVQADGTGWVDGPGTVRAATRDRGNPDTPRDLTVQWAGRLNLKFLTETVSQDSASALDRIQPQRLEGITYAEFNRDVQVDHPQFLASGRQLKLELEPIDNEDPQLRFIEASGDARLVSLSDDPAKQIELHGDKMTLHMQEQTTGDPRPDRMFAEGNVLAVRPGYRLQSQQLYAKFAQGQTDAGDFEVQLVRAQNDVRIDAQEQGVVLLAHRMTADMPEDRVELNGSAQAPAEIHRPDAQLYSESFLFSQKSSTFQSMGEGRADLDVERDGRAAKVRVTWAESMHFDNATGRLTFRGDVIATARNPQETSRLSANRLDMLFNTQADDQPDTKAKQSPEQLADEDLREAVASGNVKFEAQSNDQRSGGEPLVRLLVEGPQMVLNNARQTVKVNGKGTMLVEDYRSQEDEPTKPATATSGSPLEQAGVGLTGRGATLFSWTDSMLLNGGTNRMVMQGGVQMVHAPLNQPRDQRVRLSARQFEAVMADTGGLSSEMTSAEQADPEFRSFQASGDVQLDQADRHIVSGFLRYDQDAQQVSLWSTPPAQSSVMIEGEPNALSAEKIQWDLDRDRFEVMGIRGGNIPIGR